MTGIERKPSRSAMHTISNLSSIAPHALHRVDVPFSSRSLPATIGSGCVLSSSAQHDAGDDAFSGSEVIAVMLRQRICVQLGDQWNARGITSPFEESSIALKKDLLAPREVGDLSTNTRASPDDFSIDDYTPDITSVSSSTSTQVEVEYTGVAVSPRGCVANAPISAAVAVTQSDGGAQIWIQSDQFSEWRCKYDMSTYLIHAYHCSKWSHLPRAFDSSLPHTYQLTSMSTLRELQQRKSLAFIQCLAWSGRIRSSETGSMHFLLAMGSRAGVVTVWRINAPMRSENEDENDIQVAPSSSAALEHPRLVSTFALPVASDSSQPFVNRLSFAPIYYNSQRKSLVCTLAVGATNGRAHVYILDTSATAASFSSIKLNDSLPPAHLLSSFTLGNSFTSISCLRWSQILSLHDVPAEAPCQFCFVAESCQKAHVADRHGISVHHLLAIGCSSGLQVVAFDPMRYLDLPALTGIAAAASASSSHLAASAIAADSSSQHPSISRVFPRVPAHSAAINSLIWCIQSTSSGHTSSSLATHHIQLLSSADDDTVHRWVLRDSPSAVATGSSDGLIQCDSNKAADLAAGFPPHRNRLTLFPNSQPIHGSHGLLRSSDGLHLYTFLSSYFSPLGVHSHTSGKKRVPVCFVKQQPFPYFDLLDEEVEENARVAIEYDAIYTGEMNEEKTKKNEPTSSEEKKKDEDGNEKMSSSVKEEEKLSPSKPKKSAIEVMREQELEERKQQSRGPQPQQQQHANAEAMMDIDPTMPPLSPAINAISSLRAPPPPPPPLPPSIPAPPSANDPLPEAVRGRGRPRSNPAAAVAVPTAASSKKKKKVQKKTRKRVRKMGESSGEEESETDEWKEDEHGTGKSDGEDDHSMQDEEEATDDDEGRSQRTEDDDHSLCSAKVKSKSKSSTSASKGRRFKRSKQDVDDASNDDQPGPIILPVPLQSPELQKERIEIQVRMIKRVTGVWKNNIGQQIRAWQMSRRIEASASTDKPPSSISIHSIRSLITSIVNPYHLSVPPVLTELPTLAPLPAQQSAPSSAPSIRNNMTDPSPPPLTADVLAPATALHHQPTPFSLYWRYLPHILPSKLIPGGYSSIFLADDNEHQNVYPIDAFSHPIQRQLPFLFLADSIVQAVEEMLEEEGLTDVELEHMWIGENDAHAASSSSLHTAHSTFVRQYLLRYIIGLLQIALSLRTPFMALSRATRNRADSLHQRLENIAQLQHIKHQVRDTAATSSLQSSNEVSDSSYPHPSYLLMADWLTDSILNADQPKEEQAANISIGKDQVWKNHTAAGVTLLRSAYRIYTSHSDTCAAELALFDTFFASTRIAATASSSSSINIVVWTKALDQLRPEWKKLQQQSVARETCPLCEQRQYHAARE